MILQDIQALMYELSYFLTALETKTKMNMNYFSPALNPCEGYNSVYTDECTQLYTNTMWVTSLAKCR